MSNSGTYSYFKMDASGISFGMSSLHFAGQYDASTVYKEGDIIFDNFGMRIFQGGEFVKLSAIESSVNRPKSVSTQCRNCGAPTGLDGHCCYCGTWN